MKSHDFSFKLVGKEEHVFLRFSGESNACYYQAVSDIGVMGGWCETDELRRQPAMLERGRGRSFPAVFLSQS